MKGFFGAAIVALIVTACGVESDNNSSSLNSQFPEGVRYANVELYGTRDAKPDGFCDVFTSLELSSIGFRNVAKMENRLRGICEIYVEPNPRSYDLLATEAGCGSMKYTSKKTDATGRAYLEIIDHRSRLCEDYQPNMFIVKELINGHYYTTYSLQQ